MCGPGDRAPLTCAGQQRVTRSPLRARTPLAMPARDLHSSLRARNNVVLACVWLVALLAVAFFLGRVPWAMVAAGGVSGALQGALQRRALRDGVASFAKARTAMEVRAAMLSTSAGRAQIKVLWCSFALYFVVFFLTQHVERTPLEVGPPLFAALFAQWFVRESMTARACVELEKAVEA
jgi:hypothetical protein